MFSVLMFPRHLFWIFSFLCVKVWEALKSFVNIYFLERLSQFSLYLREREKTGKGIMCCLTLQPCLSYYVPSLPYNFNNKRRMFERILVMYSTGGKENNGKRRNKQTNTELWNNEIHYYLLNKSRKKYSLVNFVCLSSWTKREWMKAHEQMWNRQEED